MVSVMLYPYIFCIVLLMNLDSVSDLFGVAIRNIFGCGCYFVVEFMEVLSVGGGLEVLRLIDRVCCNCDTCVHPDVPLIGFVWVCICLKLSPPFGV